jgi:HD-GYP domain-containing protein (c-di-GMP phosphodiesterase class II)
MGSQIRLDIHAKVVEAVDNWFKAGKKGIFEMATGTGKTICGLECLSIIQRLEKVLCCLANILRLEEERACSTESALKEMLVAPVSRLSIVLGKALEMRDPYTFSHNRNVADIVEKISRKLGWDENRILGVRLAAELHDLGKISIPLDILNKPGKLSDLEFQLVKEHVIKCYDLMKDIEFPFSLGHIYLSTIINCVVEPCYRCTYIEFN